MMKNSNLVFRIDIPDFKSKKEIIEVLDKILDLVENNEFVDGFHNYHEKGMGMKINNNISLIISDCNCSSDELPF